MRYYEFYAKKIVNENLYCSNPMERKKEYLDTRSDKKTEELQPEPPLENEVQTP